MGTYQAQKHDIGVTNPTTAVEVGMMLARDSKGVPQYEVFDDRYLAQQFFTGQASYVNTPPEKRLLISQSDFRSGFGLEVYDENDPKRYFSSIGADLRHKGTAMAGWTTTAIAMPTPHTASDWNDAIAHKDVSTHWANEANVYDGSTVTFSQSNLIVGWTGYLEIYIPAISCTQIRYYWSETTGNGVDDLEIDVYYNDAWNAVVTDDSQGEDAYATAALGGTYNVTAVRFRFQLSAGRAQMNSVQFYATSASLMGNPVDAVEFNDILYFAIANTIYKLNGTGNGLTLVTGAALPVYITDLEVFTDDQLYICQGYSEPLWEMTTGEVLTENTLANNTMKFMKTVHTTADTMYGSDTANTIRSNTDPSDAGANPWSAQTTVGASYHNITDLLEKSGALYIPKEDMLYYLDSSGNIQNDIAPELKSETASTSGKNAHIWQGRIYYPAGNQAFLEIGTANTWLNPADYCTNLSDFVGSVMGVASDGFWLFVAIDNSASIEILAGRYEEVDGSITWVWHPIHELTLTGIERMVTSTVYQRRLWLMSTSSSDSLYYMPLPQGYGNITSDANRAFKTGSYFITPWLHGGFIADTKAFISLTLTMGHTYDTDIYWTVAYQKLGDSAWTSIGNFAGSATSMVQTKYLGNDTGGNTPSSTMLRLKFTAVTDDTTKTPILYNYQLNAILYPASASNKIIACTVTVGDEVLNKLGLKEGDWQTVKNAIDEARSDDYPVAAHDIGGTSLNVKLLPIEGGWREKLIRDEKGLVKEYHVRLLLQKVVTST